MRKVIVITIITLFVCCAAFGQKVDTTVAKKEMIVNDYFLQIPDEYIKADTRTRAIWVDTDDNENGYLYFTIPASYLPEEAGDDAHSFGSMQLFKKKSGGVIVALAVNLCVENVCEGDLLFLDYNAGNWDNITDEMALDVDPDEIRKMLSSSPAFGKSLQDDDEVPLAIEFYGAEKLIQFIADCKITCDGGVVAKIFKWNGEGFDVFEYIEGP